MGWWGFGSVGHTNTYTHAFKGIRGRAAFKGIRGRAGQARQGRQGRAGQVFFLLFTCAVSFVTLVCVCVCVCVGAWVRACVGAWVGGLVCVCVCVGVSYLFNVTSSFLHVCVGGRAGGWVGGGV